MQTVHDVCLLISAMLNSSTVALRRHAVTLLGPRTRGSTTNAGLEALRQELPLTEITDLVSAQCKAPGCRYFVCPADELSPKLGAIPYEEACVRFGKEKIKRRLAPGLHGEELYIDQPVGELEPVTYVTIVLGPENEYAGFSGGVIWTWHPGRPLSLLKEGQEPTASTAVKLHNG